jgi:uncharacterized membrane protein YedE/YeeE
MMYLAISWSNFTPYTSLAGGMLIGLASSFLIIFRGKIAGISGILGAAIDIQNATQGSNLWRVLFLIGLISSSFVYKIFSPLPELTIAATSSQLMMAGLLVGFGTRMGSGCTSGHGICGLSRLSLRSLVATLCFMSSGFVICYLFLHDI